MKHVTSKISEPTLKKLTMKTKNILILGKGYMGNHIWEHFDKSPTIISRKDLDYHDIKLLDDYITNNDIETVINCSGFTGKPNIDEAETNKELCWKLNVNVPLKINALCNFLSIEYIHISSGCVFDGYQSDWTENDAPNYGLFQDHSSFYSKTKFAFEHMSWDLAGRVLRIRMPFDKVHSGRNYLDKIRNYDNLIEYVNSKTYIPDFCKFLEKLLSNDKDILRDRQIYNVVNPDPLLTSEVCDLMEIYDQHNPNWKFVKIEDLDIKASRSNCILDCSKVMRIHQMKTEKEAMEEALLG